MRRFVVILFCLLSVKMFGANLPTMDGRSTNQWNYGSNQYPQGITFLNTNSTVSNLFALRFGFVNSGNTQRFFELPHSARLEQVNVQVPLGANSSLYSPFLSGGGSGLRELPINHELKAAMPNPVIGVVMTTFASASGTLNPFPASHTNAVQIIEDFTTNGISAHLTNAGVDIAILADTWLDNHRDGSGNLVARPSIFPGGITATATYAHTNNRTRVLFGVDAYVDSVNPAPSNAERDCDMTGQGRFDYPNGTNPNGSNPLVPMITPLTVHRDINQLYDAGVDFFLAQDISPFNYYQGYENQISRQLNDASLFPLVSVYWAAFKNTFRNRPMGIWILGDAPFFPNRMYDSNGTFPNVWDTGGFPYNHGVAPISGSGTMGWACALARLYTFSMTNAPSGAACRPVFWQALTYGPPTGGTTFSTNDFRNILSMAAMFQGHVMLFQPFNYTNFAQIVTNSGFLRVFKDPKQNPAYLVANGGTNSIWVKQLESRIEKAVLFANEGNSSTNLTFTASLADWALNSAFVVKDIWGGNVIGVYTNSYTETVTATNATWRSITLLEDYPVHQLTLTTNVILESQAGIYKTYISGSNTVNMVPGTVRINTLNGSGQSGRNALEAVKPDESNGSVAFYFSSANGAGYGLSRDTSTGLGQWIGYQAAGFAGQEWYYSGSSSSVGTSFAKVRGDSGFISSLYFGYTAVGSPVASGSTITPSGGVFHVTGVTTINTINVPYTGFIGSITIIPDGIFATGTSGNIYIASTAVVSKALIMTYDGTKWSPSY